jgi:hypothetical protein
MGSVYNVGIFSQIEEITRFPREDALGKFVPLTWSKYQSANSEGGETRGSKSGRKYLRYYLIETANKLEVPNAEH